MSSPSVTIGPFVVGEKPAPLVYQFLNADGTPLASIAGYAARFVHREQFASSASATTSNAIVDDPDLAKVRYVWTGAELPTPGHYLAEFWIGNGTNRYASVLIEFDVRAPVGAVPTI